ncbi:alpha-E domain-containing protein [Olivibacter sitiensis]|uniref:alpha-E domain-containing protein n=1 Tax=Olivibacter sitiensis TaxID=376470 RepID=UPI00048A3C1F|nr:alpha-E domain-containing protein [Olivibacter sitiensis]
MLSRIADSMFWMNRYMERVRSILRVARTHYIISLDRDVKGASWKSILEIFTLLEEKEIKELEGQTGKILQYLLTASENENSVKSLVSKARENARGIQDNITKELWEEVNSFYHVTNQPHLNHKLTGPDTLDVIDLFMRHSIICSGISDITMQRGTGWDIMKLGKYMERCMETLILTDKHCEFFQYELEKERDITQWRFLLLSLSGYEAYLKSYRTFKHNQNVMHQVLFNEDFPHSVSYSLNMLDKCLSKLIVGNKNPEIPDLIRTFGKLHAKIKYLDPSIICHMDLQTFFMEMRTDMKILHAKQSNIFFSY